MKVVVIGTRGIPDIQGGVETHCQNLYPRLAAMGDDVTVIRRKPYVTPENKAAEYRGVRLVDLYAPRRKSFEAIVHTTLAVIKAWRMKPDILHIHAVGPSLLSPLARLLGLKVVMTHHGADYNRQKWGRGAKAVLQTGERFGVRYANAVISISQYLSDLIAEKYGRRDVDLVFNGVDIPVPSNSTSFLDELGLSPGEYMIALGRFVPEKGFHDLIRAFTGLKTNCKLVIAGDADHHDAYSAQLKREAASAGVVLPGFIRGEKLNQLMTNARLFVMPSYHEGLPIALLEAMSYNLDVAVSDIPACRISQLNDADFFKAGDIDGLVALLSAKLSVPQSSHRQYNLAEYSWDSIAIRIQQIYQRVVNN